MANKNYGVSASFDLGLAKDIGIEAAVIYNELRFWKDKGKNSEGWVYKSYSEMMDKFAFSEYQLRKVYKLLVEKKIIEIKIKKIDKKPTLHYRFLKNFSFDLVSEKTKETMVSEKTKETSIYTDNNHKTTPTAELNTELQGASPTPPKAPSPQPRETRETFDELVRILHEGRVILWTPVRKSKIKKRLEYFEPKDIVDAARNLTHSKWHMGDNPNHTKYATVDFLIRSDEQVEKWLNETPVQTVKSAF